jgi:ribose/xylose/arabinose/galactoside ABC-type transport system permease subunit
LRNGGDGVTHRYAATMFGVGIPEILVFWILVVLVVWLLMRRKTH